MSYRSRVYRQRNLHSHEDASKEPFFSKQHDIKDRSNNGSFFQAKLAVGKAGDKFEKEADAVANKVTGSNAQKSVVQQKDITGIQRMPASSEEEMKTPNAGAERDEDVQQKPEANTEMEKEKEGVQRMGGEMREEDKKKPVQKKDAETKEEEKGTSVQAKPQSTPTQLPARMSSRLKHDTSQGDQLSPHILKDMNKSFGSDFNKVRIHLDADAAQMNKALNAQAFTHGKDIYFNHGKFHPESLSGKKLLAHELTHTIQQTGKEPLTKQNAPKQSDATKSQAQHDLPEPKRPQADSTDNDQER